MSWHMSELKYAFGLGGMMSFYGIVGLVVVLMPEDTMGWNYKIATIGLVLLTLPFFLIIMFVASRRSKKKARLEAEAEAAAAVSGGEQAPQQNLSAPKGNFGDLNSGAEEVIQFLKSSNLGEGGRDAVYSLPWYIVAGAPKAGKSSLVISSNLNFQTLPSQRQSEQRFVRPTGTVDWRVTSDAVFIDTAGRYQTEGVDGDEWSGLLETVKKYRSNRPLDGFVLVVDSRTILKDDERAVEELAKVLRTRLDDATARLKVRFPVYLVFTHADTIEGFKDSFSASKNEDKQLVWGATIPIEKSDNAQTLFDGEYEILQNAIMKRRLVRLSAPFPPVRQLRIFNFPLHFSSARRKFGAFVNALFRPNPFSENPFLRGFYFTASPSGRSGGAAPESVNGGFFTERLFRDVILRDKDLVKTFLAQRQRPPILGWAMTILGSLIVFLFLVFAAVSLISNNQLLASAEKEGGKAIALRQSDAGKDILAKPEKEVRDEINTIEDLRLLNAQLDQYDRERPPIYMRLGFYSGGRVYKERLLPLYLSIVEKRFAGPTVKKLEEEMKKFSESNPVATPGKLTEKEEQELGRNYDLLKAYLMLSGEQKYIDKAEASHLQNSLKDIWTTESKVPADLKAESLRQLDFWAKQVDRGPDRGNFPRINIDKTLVENTRKKLQAFPPVQRYYREQVTEISKEVEEKIGRPTSLAGLLSGQGVDSSALSSEYVIPSVYTRAGNDLMKVAISEASAKLTASNWVMGDEGKDQLAQSSDAAVLEETYYRDYADHWRKFVASIDVKRYSNKNEAEAALQSFSLAKSPIEVLMVEIVKNTNLSAPLDDGGLIEWIKGLIFGAGEETQGGTQPEKDFRPLFNFVGKKGATENAPIANYRNELGLLARELSTKDENQLKRIATEMAGDDPKDALKIGTREKNINGMLSSFDDAQTPGAKEIAVLLQEPIDRMRALLGADVKTQLAKNWIDQILPAAREIEKGYPFENSQTDTDLAKLTDFLAPEKGKFSEFYDKKLSSYFEEVGGQLKQKENAEIKFSDEFIAYLNNAMNLRKALFGSSPTPKFDYAFTLKPTTGSLVEVIIDGKKATSEGTGALTVTFPGSGAEIGVLMNLVSSGASTSPTTSSNTSTTASDPAQLKHPGPWGIFRFVDAGRPQKQGEEYNLSYSLGGKSVNATIKPSGGDLFDKTIFQKLKAPDAFIKP
jgi:type VI secretion system protein ImpL